MQQRKSEVAADGIPVVVTCRVLELAGQPYHRWPADPVRPAELEQAHRADALFDAHRDDPEFGYRFLVEEARDAGQVMCGRTAWRICTDKGWWSAFGKKKARGEGRTVGPPVQEDLVCRDFTATAPDRLWLTDITEHPTGTGKVYCAAVPDVVSRVVVGWSIADHVRSEPVVDALDMARRRHRPAPGTIVHSDSETVPAGVPRVLTRTAMDTTGCWCLGAPRGS